MVRVCWESNPDLQIHSPACYLYATMAGSFAMRSYRSSNPLFKVDWLFILSDVCLVVTFLVPYQLTRGTLSLLSVCLSFCPSVCLSFCLSVTFQFSRLFSAVFWDIDLKFGMKLLWHNTDHVWVLSRLTYFYRSHCPLLRFWDIDLNFGIWIGIDIMQIKFEFHRAWPTFTGVIALCKNLVFWTFFCSLLRYWLEIRYMNSFGFYLIQIKFEFCQAGPILTGVIALC